MTFPVVDGYRTIELGSPGEGRSLLNRLVLDGIKRATAGLVADYAEEDEPVESVGERLVLVDDDLNRLGLIEVTRVDIVPLCEVTWDFAQAEGEGFTDLADWREAHESFWISKGVDITDTTQVTCIYFDLVDET
ncbi:MAG TPA: ASCH domain-containing protein [Glaciibacter sp.]|nr:ASCH domain-containing protein [Glaciibacter sp.]